MLCHFSCVPLCYLRTTARQAPLSMGFLRQDHWRGLPLPPPGDLPDPGMEPASPTAPALAGRFFATVPPGKPQFWSKRIHVHSLRPASQALYPLGFISPRIVRKLGPEEAGFCHCWLGGGTLSWSESGARAPSSELQPDRTQGRRHGNGRMQFSTARASPSPSLSPPPSLQPEEGRGGQVQPGLRVPE